MSIINPSDTPEMQAFQRILEKHPDLRALFSILVRMERDYNAALIALQNMAEDISIAKQAFGNAVLASEIKEKAAEAKKKEEATSSTPSVLS
jgi:hypothetical protein